MKPANQSRSGGREPRDRGADVDAGDKKTPATDIQPEDTGTRESGNSGRGTASEGAMKQTSKTGSEGGSQR